MQSAPVFQQGPAYQAGPPQVSGGFSFSAAFAWDAARVILGFLTLAVAFGGTWHLVSDRDSTGPTALAVIGLIAALVALVVDIVLQRAVIGQDFDPIMRLGIRAVLVATLGIYSIYDLVHGEFQSISSSGGSGFFPDGTQHVFPVVGSGPVLALAGCALVLIGPWKDRFSLPVALWRNVAAACAALAVVANGYQAIRAIITANDLGDGMSGPIAASVTWFGMAVAAAALTWALLAGRRATWPVASLLVPAWVLVYFWQTAFNTGLPSSAGADEASMLASALADFFRSFGTVGAALLILAVVLAAAPAMSLSAVDRPSSRWIDGARGLALVSAGSLVVLVVFAGSLLGDSSGNITSDSSSDEASNGPFIWILIMALVLAAGAIFVWLSARQPATARLVGLGWGVLAFVIVAVTLLSSDSLQVMVSSDFFVPGRSGGFLAAAVLVLPLVVAAALVAPASVRADYGSPLTPQVRQKFAAAQRATAQRAEAAEQRAREQQAAYQHQSYRPQNFAQPGPQAGQPPQAYTPPPQQGYAPPTDSSGEATTALPLPPAGDDEKPPQQ